MPQDGYGQSGHDNDGDNDGDDSGGSDDDGDCGDDGDLTNAFSSNSGDGKFIIGSTSASIEQILWS